MSIFQRSPWRRSDSGNDNAPASVHCSTNDSLSARLADEARQLKTSPSPAFHARVMMAVERESKSRSRESNLPVWPQRLAFGCIAAGVALILVVAVGRLGFPGQPEAPPSLAPVVSLAGRPLTSSLELTAALDEFLGAAIVQSLVIEYENLGRDVRSAGEFIWSASGERFFPEHG